MKRLLVNILALSFTLCASLSFAQVNPEKPLMTIGDEAVSKAEFVNTFSKNNDLKKTTAKELRDYLDLFINFKLKVKEGKALQIDTSAAFQAELSSYINQSAQQYLTDNEMTERLYKECIERAKKHIHASHILINCGPDANPKDTLMAYKKALKIRKQILKGLDFNEAAVRYSEDPSARDYINPQNGRKQAGNKGDISYFTVFNLIYPFETGAYNTPVGKVSMPVRTRFGYHLIYVQDVVPAISKIYAAHILVSDTNAKNGIMSEEAKGKIEEIQQKLKQGVPFAQLVVEYSDDIATNIREGHLQPFAPNQRAGNFVSATIHLKNNEISQPVASVYGWHIIRLDSIVYLTVNDELEGTLRMKLGRDNRSFISKESFISNLKKQYNYEESGKAQGMKFLCTNIPTNYFQSTTADITTLPGITELPPMATYADQQLTTQEFAKYVSRFQGIDLTTSLEKFLKERFDKFAEDNLYSYEKEHLINKYPDFKELVNEYHDGMILYEINSQKIWAQAITDTTGLREYYEKIKKNYPIDPNANPVEYKTLNEIKAVVITEFQNHLDELWLQELRQKYPVVINEDVYATILKK
ncbi:MAG: peptidylprolyl isomerase [Bacteroidales bacterium]|nr:peptidylprolyl isomerase [Bacteroidales bacterium]